MNTEHRENGRQYFTIYTERGDVYDISDLRHIIWQDMNMCGSPAWTAICLRDRYGRIVGRFDRPNTIPTGSLRFKNGNGKYWLQDFDHVTHRQWGDRITEIHVYNMPKVSL